MTNIDEDTTLIALVISLVALVIACGQFLQQIFSTAEGYRRCQDSVLGPWAKRTRLVWRWSQFRFEVKFTTAHITIEKQTTKSKSLIRASTQFQKQMSVPLNEDGAQSTSIAAEPNSATDVVSWIKLIQNLEREQWTAQRYVHLPNTVIASPAMRLREWSWDLMPPEVCRPTATTTLGTLVVIAHRLGMGWRDLRPSEGFLRAEGNGQSISATTVRGFGLLLQYQCEDAIFENSLDLTDQVRIPTEAADMMGCGIIPGCKELLIRDIPCLSQDKPNEEQSFSSLVVGLQNFGVFKDTIEAIIREELRYGLLYDFLFMVMPFLCPYGAGMAEVFDPLRIGRLDDSYLRLREVRIVLRARLNNRIEEQKRNGGNPSLHLQKLLGHLDLFAKQYPNYWSSSATYERKNLYPSKGVIDACHSVWDELTTYFVDLQNREKDRVAYNDLVTEHLTCNINAWPMARQEAWFGEEGSKSRDDYTIVKGSRSPGMVVVGHIYADNIANVQKAMKKRGCTDDRLLEEAIWTLLVRAIFCGMPTILLPKESFPAVSSDFWESRTPVYIT